jgi:YafQ family addiction module toxin component
MYYLKIKPDLEKTLKKLARKNNKQLEIIPGRAEEILGNPHRYKNLRAPLNNWKRVHIDRHFVLVFSVDDESNTVTLEDYAHHDGIYK